MKKGLILFCLLAFATIVNAQSWPTYPFTTVVPCHPPQEPPSFPVPCHTDELDCTPNGVFDEYGVSINVNDNISLNYNVTCSLTTKFNYTNTFHNKATILKDNRSSAIDYFKQNQCDLFVATVNTQAGKAQGTNRDYTACIVSTFKFDLSINWEAQLKITDPSNNVLCDVIPQDIYINNQSEILVCGKIISSSVIPIQANDFAAKFDSTGTLLWINYYVTCVPTIQEDAANVILDDENGRVLIAGQSEHITNTGDEKPYLVIINSSTGAIIDKSSLPFNGKYTDAIYLGNDRYATVGTGFNPISFAPDKDMICSIWELSGGTTIQLLYNHFIGETTTSGSDPVIEECAWSVVRLGDYLMVASERKEGNAQSSTIISKFDIASLIAGTSPVSATKHIIHNDMTTDPNYSLIPVKLSVPPYNPNKTLDHFSVVLNKYTTLTTSGSFMISTLPVSSGTYSTNPVKADAFAVFELDDNLSEITNGNFNWFEGNNLEPMDVSATNNYYENIAILSLDNTNDDNFNIFIRSTLDRTNQICDKNCEKDEIVACDVDNMIYNSCVTSTDLAHSWNTTTSYSASGTTNTFNHTSGLTSRMNIIEKCSTLCNVNVISDGKVIKESGKIKDFTDFKLVIESNASNNTSNSNNHVIVSDIVGRIICDKRVTGFDDLANIVNNLSTGVYVIQLEANNQVYKYKILK